MRKPSFWHERNVLLFFLFQFLVHLEFFNGLLVVFLTEKGVTPELVNFLVFTTTIVRVVGEVPSGYLGDRFGDKPMLIVGTLLMVLFAIGLFYGSSPWLWVPVFVLHGLSLASTSGADDGFLYRTVLQGDDARLCRMRPISTALNYVSLGMAAVLGGILVQFFGWNSIFFIFVICCVVALLALANIQTKSVISHGEAVEATTFANIWHTVTSCPRLVVVLALFAMIEAAANIVFVYAQFRAVSTGLGMLAIGFVMGAVEIVSASGAFLSRYISMGSAKFTMCLVALVASLALAFTGIQITFVCCFLLFLLIATMFKIMAETFIVTEIDTALTVTSLSLFSLLISGFTGGMHLLFSILGHELSQNGIVKLLFVVTMMASGALLVVGRREWISKK